MMTYDQAKDFATQWIDAFNAHDLDSIFTLYDDDFTMTSPYIVERMGVENGQLKGKDNIKPYWSMALTAQPPLLFELIDVFVGVSSVIIYYRSVGRQCVCESFTFNNEGKVIAGVSQHRV